MSLKPLDILLIGASTGGPKTLGEIFEKLKNARLRFPVVIVNHIPPGPYAQNLVNKLSRESGQTVKLAKDGTALKAGVVYVCPGGYHVEFGLNIFKSLKMYLSTAPPENNCRPSINHMMRSASQLKSYNTAAIIMTGLGDDGATGAKLFKQAKLPVYVQLPSECVADSMPKSIIKAELHDQIFDIEGITYFIKTGRLPLRKIRLSKAGMDAGEKMLASSALGCLAPIFQKLFGSARIPPNGKSMELRIVKLQKQLGYETLEDFVADAKKNGNVMNTLVDQITNHESFFFRDNYPFNFIKDELVPDNKKTLRVWSAACALGQEIYSLSYVFNEQKLPFKTQLIASDVSSVAVQKARDGIYSKLQISRGLDQSLKLKMMDNHQDDYKIKPKFKDNVQFMTLNLMDDKFKVRNLDIILCRYVLIYFDEVTKKKIIENIIESLNIGGYVIFDPPTSLKVRSSKLQVMNYQHHKVFKRVA